jgi:hypothetical protein
MSKSLEYPDRYDAYRLAALHARHWVQHDYDTVDGVCLVGSVIRALNDYYRAQGMRIINFLPGDYQREIAEELRRFTSYWPGRIKGGLDRAIQRWNDRRGRRQSDVVLVLIRLANRHKKKARPGTTVLPAASPKTTRQPLAIEPRRLDHDFSLLEQLLKRELRDRVPR